MRITREGTSLPTMMWKMRGEARLSIRLPEPLFSHLNAGAGTTAEVPPPEWQRSSALALWDHPCVHVLCWWPAWQRIGVSAYRHRRPYHRTGCRSACRAARVVVTDSLCVSDSLHDRIGLHQTCRGGIGLLDLALDRLATALRGGDLSDVGEANLHRLRLAGTTLSGDEDGLRLLLSHHLGVRRVDEMVTMRHQQLGVLGATLLVPVTDGFANSSHILEGVDGDNDVSDIRVDDLLAEAILKELEDTILGQLRHVAHVVATSTCQLCLEGHRVALLMYGLQRIAQTVTWFKLLRPEQAVPHKKLFH